jgi:FkbM family methyltransferase
MGQSLVLPVSLMGIRQFSTSLFYIWRIEHPNKGGALVRHLLWQARKLGGKRPISRRLSQSVLTDDEQGDVISSVNMLGVYDFNNMSFVKLVLENGGAFIDVGANIGSYTLIASECEKATVLSIEPNPTAFKKLQRNISQNARGNVIAINAAASSRAGVLVMTNEGGSSTNRIVSGSAPPTAIEVNADTLDALCSAHGITPKLIKIDVEGHEPDVLGGAEVCLRQALAVIVENGERSTVRETMTKASMKGPFYYDHRRRSLSRRTQRWPEDAIYIGLTFESDCPDIGVAE